jgi:asparagine synthase (glutamine-hydrolysing)
MPGTTIVTGAPTGAVDDALDAVQFFDTYGRTDVVSDGDVNVAHTGYDSYPVRQLSVDGYTVLLEGYLYGTEDVTAALASLADRLAAGDREAVGEWIGNRDGDFLAVVRPDDGDDTWVVNDAFGRLPTYRADLGDATVVTRELKVVRRLADSLDPDRLGIAQMLLLGYPLETRTLYDGVETLPPGSVTTIGDGTDVERAHRFSFEDYRRASESVQANARALAEQFVTACDDRAAVVDRTIVSLSGGLDSRAVLAGYEHTNRPVLAATSANESGGNATEVNVARQVADAVGIEWTCYVASTSERHRRNLLDMHQGMNRIDAAHGADFVEQVSRGYPTTMFVTGDGGDKALPDMTPAATPASIADLVGTIVKSQGKFDVEEAAEMAGIPREELLASIRDRFRGYPESDLDAKYVHFLVRERAINQFNQGEDRSRYYMWSTTPFYSVPFFREAMACPPDQKHGSELYQSFLETLSPAAVDVDYVDFRAPINSREYRVKKTVYDAIAERPALLGGVKRLLGRDGGGGDTTATYAITNAVRDGNLDDAPFSRECLQRVAWDRGGYTPQQRYIVLTVLGALSERPETAVTTEPESA